MAEYKYATKELSINNAKAFIAKVRADDTSTEKNSNILYAMIGRHLDYLNEPTPDTPIETNQDKQYEVWRQAIAAKKITGDDISHVIRRIDWTAGIVYDMYTDIDSDIYNKDFYVLTDEMNVYKCLFNNNGQPSTVKPTGYSILKFTTSDNYTWKFLYSIPLGDSEKFLTAKHMPVKTLVSGDGSVEQSRQLDVQNAAVNGSIEIVTTDTNGLNYETVENIVVVTASGTTIRLSDAGANPPSPIDNFYNGSSIYLTSGLGSGQLKRIIKYAGSTKTATVNSAFTTVPNSSTRVNISPTVTIIGDGENAEAYSSVDSGTGGIDEIIVINRGSGYTRAEAIISANSVHGSGGTATPIISPVGGHGLDPVRELGADQVMLNVKIIEEEGLSANGNGYIPVDMGYRSISILKDPLLKVDANNNIISSEVVANTSNSPSTLRLTHKYKISYNQMNNNVPINALQVGDSITNERIRFRAEEGTLEFITELNAFQRQSTALANAFKGANANIVHIEDDPTESDTSFYNIYVNDVNSYGRYVPFAVNDSILKNTSAIKVATIKGLIGPEANTFSGEILYTSNVQKIVRDNEQTEDIKIILDF